MLYSLIAFVVLLALELLYFVVARRFHVVDRPNERSSHKKVTLRGAGVVFYLAVLLYSLTHGMAFYHFLIGASLLAVVCYADDVRDVPSWLRMLTQLAALIVAFYIPVQGIELWKILLIIIVFTGILNIFNFLDGINGMLAAYSLLSVTSISSRFTSSILSSSSRSLPPFLSLASLTSAIMHAVSLAMWAVW